MADSFQGDKGMIWNQAAENIIDRNEYSSAEGLIKVPFGETEDGELIIEDLSELSHMMVLGQSGSGKTSFVRTLLSVILSRKAVEDVTIMIYDSIRVDYIQFENVPHLLKPIMTEHDEVVAEIKSLLFYAKNRLEHIAKFGCRNIKSYNLKRSEEDIKIPDMFFVLDDFALLQLNDEEMEDLLSLCRNGRSSGIHIIIVSSVFSKKRNMLDLESAIPCHVCFRVGTKANSVDAVGRSGAEVLSVPGEMIYKYDNQCCKCQCVYSTYENIGAVMRTISHEKANIPALGIEASMLFSDINTVSESPVDDYDEEYDELLTEIADFVIEKGKGSIGMIQRNFKIGFNRAERIMNQLEEMGVVGPEEGTRPRKVLKRREGDSYVDFPKDERIAEEVNEPENQLRDFPEFKVGNMTYKIKDNKIYFSKPIMTRDGAGTLSSDIPVNKIVGLIYKKPSLFSKGYMTFEFEQNTSVSIDRTDLWDEDVRNISEIIKAYFGNAQDKIVKSYLEQISEDIGIPIRYV